MTAFAANSLLAHLATLPDPRSPHGRRFSLLSLLAAACAAMLCCQTSYAAIAQWTRNQPPELLRALGFYRKPPTDGAFRYLFALLDLSAFEAALAAWIAALLPVPSESLRPTPLDGKTLRGSDDKLRGAVHLLSLLDGPTGGVLKQLAVDAKTNEHKAAFALLRGMVLRGRILTADAMFCHRDFAQQIRDQDGHYFFEVKDNQEQLKRDIASAFEPAFSPLLHEPAEGVSFGGLPPRSPFEDALDLVSHGLEVAEARPQRRLQVRQRVEQTVVRRTPTQLFPHPLYWVQLRAIARQPVELQVRVVPQRPVDRLAPVPRGVVDHHHDPRVSRTRVDPPDMAQMRGERFLHPARLALARPPRGVLWALQGVGVDRGTDQVDDREHVQQVFAVPGSYQRPVALHPQRRCQRGDHGEAGLVLAQQDEFTGRRPFPRSARSSWAWTCFWGLPRK